MASKEDDEENCTKIVMHAVIIELLISILIEHTDL